MLTDEGVREAVEGAKATGFRVYADRVVRFGEEVLRLRGYLRVIVREGSGRYVNMNEGEWTGCVEDVGILEEIEAWAAEDQKVNP